MSARILNEHKAISEYLDSGIFIDSDHPAVVNYTNQIVHGLTDPTTKAIALYLKIRDEFRYDPENLDLSPEGIKASALLQRDYGYCIEKACLLAACARVAGIPSRLGFANVRNHIGTGALQKRLGTDVLVFHGYTELYLNQKWVKATPAFNQGLCDILGVECLGFNGREDSVFQEYDQQGGEFMEYLKDHGVFADVPYEKFIREILSMYPHLFKGEEAKYEGFIQRAKSWI